MKEEYKKPAIALIVVVLISSLIWALNKDSNDTEVLKSSASETSFISDDEMKDQLDEILTALMHFHYISVDDKELDNPDTFILDMLSEAMNDLNKLKSLQVKTQNIEKSPNEVIATTGFVIKTSSQLMIPAYESWIQYLRGVDANNVSVSEFQYQLAKFNSSTHDVYLKLVEGSSLLPMVTVVFGENGAQNTVNEDLKTHFLAKIDELFDDIFADDDQFYRETKNRVCGCSASQRI
jgi:hypothetical protein